MEHLDKKLQEMKNAFTKIIVNGREKPVLKKPKKIRFGDVITLAFGSYEEHPNRVFTVTFAKGLNGSTGSMVAGQSVMIQEGMVFNVTVTDKS